MPERGCPQPTTASRNGARREQRYVGTPRTARRRAPACGTNPIRSGGAAVVLVKRRQTAYFQYAAWTTISDVVAQGRTLWPPGAATAPRAAQVGSVPRPAIVGLVDERQEQSFFRRQRHDSDTAGGPPRAARHSGQRRVDRNGPAHTIPVAGAAGSSFRRVLDHLDHQNTANVTMKN